MLLLSGGLHHASNQNTLLRRIPQNLHPYDELASILTLAHVQGHLLLILISLILAWKIITFIIKCGMKTLKVKSKRMWARCRGASGLWGETTLHFCCVACCRACYQPCCRACTQPCCRACYQHCCRACTQPWCRACTQPCCRACTQPCCRACTLQPCCLPLVIPCRR